MSFDISCCRISRVGGSPPKIPRSVAFHEQPTPHTGFRRSIGARNSICDVRRIKVEVSFVPFLSLEGLQI